MVGFRKKIAIFLSAALTAASMSGAVFAETSATAGENIVMNGSFDSDASGWNGLGTSGGRTTSWVDNVEGTTGGCLSVVYNPDVAGGNNGSPGFSQGIKLERDVWYVMSARVKIMDFDPANPETPKNNAAASIFLTNLPEITDEVQQYHAYATVAQDTPLPVTEYEADGKTMCSTEWTTIRGYFKYSGPETYENANCDIQIRGSRDNNNRISYYVDDVEVYKMADFIANGDFEDTGYTTTGRISSTAANTTSFTPWVTETSAGVSFTQEAAKNGSLGAYVSMENATAATLPALSQYVSLPLGQSVGISASIKIADDYTLPDNVAEVKAQILYTHNTYATEVASGERKMMDCGTDYLVTEDVADGQWHDLSTVYNTSWNIEQTSKGAAEAPANCNGRMYFRLTAVVDGAEDRSVIIPYYVDDVAITASNIQVGELEFFEEHDLAPIEYLTETSEVFGRVNITNNTGKQNDVNVLMAGYNYQNRLVQLVSESLSIGADEKVCTYSTKSGLDITKGITKAKLMVWSSDFTNAKPYVAPCEITGDFNKINNSLNKLYSTGKLCVGFIGGSITQGSGANPSTNGYAYQTIEWLKDRFPEYEIEGHVAGVGGTGSDLGTCRLGEELLVYNPDLVFIEFAVNDGGDPSKKASTEGIIRQVKEHNPDADMVLVNTLQLPGFANDYGAKQIPLAVQYKNEVADHYNLGVINVGKALYYTMVDEERTEPGYYMSDNAHPSNAGHTHYKDTIARYIDSLVANADLSVPSSVLVEPMDENYFTGTVVGLDDPSVTLDGDWTERSDKKAGLHNLWESNTPGDSIEYTFTGTGIGLYMRVAPDTGIINYQIDGGEIKQFDTCDQYVKQGMDRIFYTFLETSLDREEHTAKIWVSGEQNPACTDCMLSIGALLIKD